MSPLEAWLYFDQMNLSRYWPENAPLPWDEFFSRFRDGEVSLEECSFLSPSRRHAFQLALNPQTYLPSIPSIDVPQPIAPDLFPLNEPDRTDLLLVTANSHLTFDIIAAIWAQGITPAYLLLIDCQGHTVDMALVFKSFTGARLREALERSELEKIVNHRRIIIPGLAAPLVEDFTSATGWEIEIGPVCAAEIPLFLGERWTPA